MADDLAGRIRANTLADWSRRLKVHLEMARPENVERIKTEGLEAVKRVFYAEDLPGEETGQGRSVVSDGKKEDKASFGRKVVEYLKQHRLDPAKVNVSGPKEIRSLVGPYGVEAFRKTLRGEEVAERQVSGDTRIQVMEQLRDQTTDPNAKAVAEEALDLLRRKQPLTPDLLKKLRYNLYRNRMRSEADLFRTATEAAMLPIADYQALIAKQAGPDEYWKKIHAAETSHVGLFIPVPEPLASEFPSLGDEDTSPPHVTLLYVGDVPADRRDEFLRVCQEVLAKEPGPIKAWTNGVDFFTHPDKNRQVFYVPIRFSRDMGAIRDRLTSGFQYGKIVTRRALHPRNILLRSRSSRLCG